MRSLYIYLSLTIYASFGACITSRATAHDGILPHKPTRAHTTQGRDLAASSSNQYGTQYPFFLRDPAATTAATSNSTTAAPTSTTASSTTCHRRLHRRQSEITTSRSQDQSKIETRQVKTY